MQVERDRQIEQSRQIEAEESEIIKEINKVAEINKLNMRYPSLFELQKISVESRNYITSNCI